MFAAFKERRPWAAALVTLLLDPVIGMLYLSRWRLSLLYLVLELMGGLGIAYFFGPVASATNAALAGIIAVLVRVGGSAHAYFTANRHTPDEKLHWYARWYSVAAFFLILETLPWTIHWLPYRSFDLPTASMEPSLARGDCFFADQAVYEHVAPGRGDAIVFHVPHEPSIIYAKRIVGIPGDRVQMKGGVLYLNGAPARLKNLDDVKGDCSLAGCAIFHRYVEMIPGAHPYRIQNANFGTELDNTTVFVVPPDSYFVLGDNRSNSRDSRMDDFGYVPRNAIIGRVAIKYFDGTTRRWVWQPIN